MYLQKGSLLCLTLSIIIAYTDACGNFFTTGTTKCVKLNGYYGYQWATCLTDTYIHAKSLYKHRCNSYLLYKKCWYQCMLEKYYKESGSVYRGCACNPNPTPPPLTLPSWCYSPSGDSCSWYRDCLEKRFQCSRTKYGYAIEYGKKFCEEYDKNYQQFSTLGRKWVDGVRKCLQVALVPYIRPYERKRSCSEIKNLAMNSHRCCYTAGSKCSPPNTPSICDIPCMDWLRVTWKIKEAFVDESVETVSGIWHVARQCPITSSLFKCIDELGSYMKFLTMDLYIRLSRQRRSSDMLNIDKEKVASDLSKSLSSQLSWNTNKIDWFVYTDEDETTSNNMEVNFVFVDKNLRYLTPQHSNTSLSILDDLVDEMMNKIESGNVTFVTQSEVVHIQLNKLSTCDGIRCDNKTFTIFPPSTTTTSTTTTTTTTTTTATTTKTTSTKKTTKKPKESTKPTTTSVTPISGKKSVASRISIQYFSLLVPLIFIKAIC